ncbi:type II toxin-antitoxin system mRNA interferase toxin, RelE/StbE family [Candidatus Woesearchaeota archaeon]|nr:type II toxin-antitoxin system mRNA interferase toxin, RelE/StbE family [Candidatus Woesearchaeota archaeon]
MFRKLSKKNPQRLLILGKKIQDIREEPYGYKFLRKPLQGFNRVHIDKHFVLIFKVDHERKSVVIYYYDHHDYVYGWQP